VWFLTVASGALYVNYDSAGCTSDSNALKTSKSSLPSVRTSMRTPCVSIKKSSWRLQYGQMAVYGEILAEHFNNCRKIQDFGVKTGGSYINHWALKHYLLKHTHIGQFNVLVLNASSLHRPLTHTHTHIMYSIIFLPESVLVEVMLKMTT